MLLKMQRTMLDFCSSQRERSDDGVSDAGSSVSLVSSDVDSLRDTITESRSSTLTETSASTDMSDITTTCLGTCCKMGA